MNTSLSLIIPPQVCDIKEDISTFPEINASTARDPISGIIELLKTIYNFITGIVTGGNIADCLPPGFDMVYRSLILTINFIVAISVFTWMRALSPI